MKLLIIKGGLLLALLFGFVMGAYAAGNKVTITEDGEYRYIKSKCNGRQGITPWEKQGICRSVQGRAGCVPGDHHL